MISTDIIQGCKRKEEQAYRICYEACAPYAYTIIKNYISDESYRKDAMQEVFASLFLSFKNYDSKKGAFKSWFATLVIRTCIDILRKRKKLNLFIPLQEEMDHEEDIDFMFEMKREDIESLISHMPEGYRAVFLLSVIDEYTHEEIAELLNINKSTSRSQLSRATKWLKKNLGNTTKQMIYG